MADTETRLATSYGPADAAYQIAGAGMGGLIGLGIADYAHMDGVGKAIAIGGSASMGGYLALRFAPHTGAPQIPQEGQEIIGIAAGIAMTATSVYAIAAFAPMGPTAQYIASGATATMAYSIAYEIARVTYNSTTALIGVANSFVYTLFPFLKPSEKKEEDEDKDEKDEKKKEEKEKKKKKGMDPPQTGWDSYIGSKMAYNKTSAKKAK